MMSPRRYRHARIEQIIFRDPIGLLQLAGAFGSFLRAIWALAFDPHIWTPSTAYVFFRYFPEWAWALLLLGAGGWQWWAAGTKRWQAQLLSAGAQIAMLAYGIMVAILTGSYGAGGLPLSLAFLAMQILIAMRVEHDRDVGMALDALRDRGA